MTEEITVAEVQTSNESIVTETSDNVTEPETAETTIQTTLQESTDAENAGTLTTVPNRGNVV